MMKASPGVWGIEVLYKLVWNKPEGKKYFNEFSMLLPVLWANVEPDEDVSDGLEEEEGHHREHREEGEEVPGVRILYSSKEIDIGE